MDNRRITLFGAVAALLVAVVVGLVWTRGHHVSRATSVPVTPVAPVSHRTAHAVGRVPSSAAGPTAAPLLMPVNGSIQSGFGWQYSGALNEWYYNPGITIAAKTGLPVRAAWAGRVVSVAHDPHMGTTVTVDDGDGFETVYGHLGHAAVKAGETVTQGQTVGTVGGPDLYSRQSGSHVDFQVFHGSTASNPMGYFHPSS